jgi:hypothetical protein
MALLCAVIHFEGLLVLVLLGAVLGRIIWAACPMRMHFSICDGSSERVQSFHHRCEPFLSRNGAGGKREVPV